VFVVLVLVELATMAGLVVVPLATEAAAGVFDGLVEELETIDEWLAVELAEIVEFDMIAPASRNYDIGEICGGFFPSNETKIFESV
jgi:hypothetical protein